MKRVSTKDMSREQWLEMRRKGLGGSDAACLLGLNPWKSLYELYYEKTGFIEDKESTESMRLGTDLEQYVAERYMEQTGKKVQRTNFIYFDEEYDFMFANIDREIVGENAGLECKITGTYSATDYGVGDVPANYYYQCQWYMMIRKYDYMDLSPYVLQKGLFVNRIERNDAVIAQLRQAAIDFWTKNVLTNTPPEPDGSESSLGVLKKLYPQGNEALSVSLDDNLERMLSEYTELGEAVKRMEGTRDEIKAHIAAHMGEAAIANGMNWTATYKSQERTSVDEKALKSEYPEIYEKVKKVSSFRVLRLKKV